MAVATAAAVVAGGRRGRTGSAPIKKPSTCRAICRRRFNQSQFCVGASVLFSVEHLFATVPFAHQAGNAAAVPLHGVEQLVPEGAGAEAGHDGQIEANIDEGAAQRTAAQPTLEFLQ